MIKGRPNGGSSVVLDDVDDYLAPSQACVNPLFQPKKAETPKDGDREKSDTASATPAVVVPRKRKVVRRRPVVKQVDVHVQNSENIVGAQHANGVSDVGIENSDTTKKKNENDDVVKASIADCLACSGCVTTAETVLLEQQHSLTSLRNRLSSMGLQHQQKERRKLVVTISPNSWADMCRHWRLDKKNDDEDEEMSEKDDQETRLAQFSTMLSKILSATAVVDGNVPLQWTWIDEAEEFCKTYEDATNNVSLKSDGAAAIGPSAAIDSKRTQYYKPDGTMTVVDNDTISTPPQLPLISGSCPALVCLVEKNLNELVPHLSQSMSPMSMLGMCLKDSMASEENRSGSQENDVVWDHWAVMPCHDKKLEASRKDYYLASGNGTNNKEEQHAVDLVISTQECVELVEEWIRSQFVEMTDVDSSSAEEMKLRPMTEYLDSFSPCRVATVWDQSQLRKTLCHTSNDTTPILIAPPKLECVNRSSDSESMAEVPTDLMQMAFASGGHANFIFLYAAKKLFGYDLEKVEWQPASASLIGQTMKNVRSARLGRQQRQHFYEARLYRHNNGSYSTGLEDNSKTDLQPVLHFCIAHGMQTMQRALKLVTADEGKNRDGRRIPKFHYLEAMACPHGCVNGGGAARQPANTSVENKVEGDKAVAKSPSTTFRETPTETRSRVKSTLDLLSVPLERTFLDGIPGSPDTVRKFHRTRYHVVPPMQHTMGAVAGEKVDTLFW